MQDQRGRFNRFATLRFFRSDGFQPLRLDGWKPSLRSVEFFFDGDYDSVVNVLGESCREMKSAMPTVTFVNEKKTIEVPAGANLRKEAIKAGVQLYPGPHRYVNCLGNGLCCSCRVVVKKGLDLCSRQGMFEKVSMITNPLAFFARLGHEKDLRLACQMRVNGDIEVERKPPMNWHGENFWS